MVCRMEAHSRSLLGSKTAHWVRRSIECSRKLNSRRTLTYFHSGSELIVRAPQTRLARPSKKRSALMPSGLSTDCRS